MGSFVNPNAGIYDPDELERLHGAIEAVCTELGIEAADAVRREAVAGRVLHAWSRGGRLPLNLIEAGLEGA
ncbi:hypothetical protein N1F89_19790 [Aquibium sp. A9E412]|uniref:hypothetical protein n=1 Tax=Aquibium sp. A9E412 TaxID=2976767 RepID=UPI0025B1543E|nr:hypothetical protein [Aquibium sp. A9E412]MDN2568473.1 hypothetical protein [Aquibium sp. A9E412]